MEIRIGDIDCERLLKRSLARGGDFAEIYFEHRRGTSIICEAHRIEKFLVTSESGVAMRVVMGDRSAFAYTNDASSLDDLADTVASAVRAGSFPGGISLRKRSPVSIVQMDIDPGGVSPRDKIAQVQKADTVAWGMDDSVVQARVMYGDGSRRVFVANSLGFIAEDSRDSLVFVVQGIVTRDSLMETGYEPVGGSRGYELLTEIPPEEVARRAISRALTTLRARRAPAGTMPVVLSSEAGGTMIHEAIGHGLEADLAGEGLSVYSGKLGQQVASPAITVIDDGSIRGLRGSMGCDDEGSPTQRSVLVDKGVLAGFMTDLLSARKYGLPLTGNARRESYRHRPVPRMTNTMIQPGPLDPDEVVKKAARGIFVKKMGGGQVNTVTGDFVFNISEGYLIENGSVGEPVRGATLIGNGPKVLSSIELVGNDLGFGIGTCGKDGQGVPVADAQPTLLIPEITVGGEIRND
ncbi:MAG TPA: TldD/PmbA family protein [Deltaproteobacteria bacterium]|nr:TldD/PmbA family protein [Deltaproteobacteria bacterium]